MKLWIYGFFMAWGMFLAIPCPFKKWDEKARGRMMVFLPVIGVIVGGLWALAAWLLGLIGCPAPLYALIIAVIPWLVTGFIHLDGFMDVSDAVLSQRDIENKRRILKDPHCGAFAVISMVLLGLASYAAASVRMLELNDLLPLALIPVASRASAGIAVMLLKPMPGSQYSAMKLNKLLVIPIAVFAMASVTVPIVLFGLGGIAPAAVTLGYWVFALFAISQLGGMSGDVSGYALTISELIGLLVLMLVK